MFVVMLTDSDGDEMLMPSDEYPGTVVFTDLESAKQVASEMIGHGICGNDEENIAVSSRVMELREVL